MAYFVVHFATWAQALNFHPLISHVPGSLDVWSDELPRCEEGELIQLGWNLDLRMTLSLEQILNPRGPRLLPPEMWHRTPHRLALALEKLRATHPPS